MKDQEYAYSYDDEEDRKYCYPGTNVLINKADIRELESLHEFERRYSALRAFELMKRGVTGDFSLRHLCSIHKYLFQDIYSWAGKIRTVDIAKGNMFCKVQYIQDSFDSVLSDLKTENFLKDIEDISNMSERLAFYLSELNAIHPFREGNGRTQRLYCHQLCVLNGRFELHFENTNKNAMVNASISSFMKDYTPMNEVIRSCLVKSIH